RPPAKPVTKQIIQDGLEGLEEGVKPLNNSILSFKSNWPKRSCLFSAISKDTRNKLAGSIINIFEPEEDEPNKLFPCTLVFRESMPLISLSILSISTLYFASLIATRLLTNSLFSKKARIPSWSWGKTLLSVTVAIISQ